MWRGSHTVLLGQRGLLCSGETREVRLTSLLL